MHTMLRRGAERKQREYHDRESVNESAVGCTRLVSKRIEDVSEMYGWDFAWRQRTSANPMKRASVVPERLQLDP